jgi:mono/diheme cytochrome c family protein
MSQFRISVMTALLVVVLAGCTQEEPGEMAQAVDAGTRTLEQRVARGEKLYAAHCAACHQASGHGLAGAFPPLAGADYLQAGPAAVVNVILNGLSGPIVVNGKEYNSVMPNLSYLNDSDVADVVTFVMNSWGNPGGEVSPAEVSAARKGN